MFKCPHCGDWGITAWRMLWLGPAIPATCQRCQKNVGVPWRTMAWYAPIWALVVVGVEMKSASAAMMIGGAAMLYATYVALKRTRLVAR